MLATCPAILIPIFGWRNFFLCFCHFTLMHRGEMNARQLILRLPFYSDEKQAERRDKQRERESKGCVMAKLRACDKSYLGSDPSLSWVWLSDTLSTECYCYIKGNTVFHTSTMESPFLKI